MIPLEISQCPTCQHFQGLVQFGKVYFYTCAAFPKRIPDEIMFDGADHTQPWKGDQGIRYKKKEQPHS